MKPWHEQDRFWEMTAPAMFGERLIAVAPQDVEDIVALLGIERRMKHPAAKVLDLCCGVGRHSIEFARLGFQVTAVDRTQAYLDRASARAEAEGLAIEFVRADMREFCREGAYDAVVNLYTAFGYFEDIEDDRQVVRNVHRSLAPGGAFVLEMMGKEVLARIYQARDWAEMDDGSLLLQERTLSQDWSWMENRWILIKDGVRTEFPLSHRIYSAAELKGLLAGCGFAETKAYGDLGGAPYDQTARRLVVVAHR
jgi:SAM-dependent methyltransferase